MLNKTPNAQKAYTIYVSMTGSSRPDVIAKIVTELGVSQGYASTLYAGAKKRAAGTTPAAATPTPTPTSTKITRFDRPTCRRARERIEEVMAELGDELGVGIALGSGSFNNEEFKVTVRLVASTSDDDGNDVAKRDWDRHCESFGLKPEQFGTTFESNGTTFTVVGIKPRATRYPVLGVNASGTRYKFPAHKLPGGVSPARRPRLF